MKLPENGVDYGRVKGQLLETVRTEIEDYNASLTHELSSFSRLASRFNISSPTVIKYVHEAGLYAERVKSKREPRSTRLSASTELAWLIGVIATGGSTSSQSTYIKIKSYDQELLDAFKITGENIFQVPGSYYLQEGRKDKGRDYQLVSFYDKEIVQLLGDLRRDQWPSTLVRRHEWIIREPQYIWRFLEGAFETSGIVSTTQRRIGLQTYFPVEANMFLDMLNLVDINRPTIIHSPDRTYGMRGVGIYNVLDLKRFAQNIHSVIPRKEAGLEFYRQIQSKPLIRAQSNEEVIHEWQRLTKLLGHTPSSREIQQMKKRGETKFSLHVYLWRFGKSWGEARSNLMSQSE